MINKANKPKQNINSGNAVNQVGTSSNILNEKKQFFIDAIAKFCDKCGTQYQIQDVELIQESSFSSIIHFTCQNCKSTHIATFFRPLGVSSRMPVNSDLRADEIAKFSKKNSISADEILNVYSTFEKVPGLKSV